VFLAAFTNDAGFYYSSAAEPYPDVDTSLDDAGFSEEQIAALYAAPQDDDDSIASAMAITYVARSGEQLLASSCSDASDWRTDMRSMTATV
ncbi:MAG: hypothetical protein SGPRY_012392, partial [Prymnesium sp.]